MQKIEQDLYSEVSNSIKIVNKIYGYNNKKYRSIQKDLKKNPIKAIEDYINDERKNGKPTETFFVLKELKALAYSIENIIINKEYIELFKKADINYCKLILANYGGYEYDKYSLKIIVSKFYRICDKLEEHHISPTWFIPTIVVILSVLLRFIFYVIEVGRCNYWSISTSAIDIKINSIYDFFIFVSYFVFVFAYASILSMPYENGFFKKIKKIEEVKEKAKYSIIVLLRIIITHVSIYFLTVAISNLFINSLGHSFLLAFAIYILCLGVSILLTMKKKDKEKDAKKEKNYGTLDYLFACLLITVAIFAFNFLGRNSEKDRKEFKIIDNSYVIVYSTQDSYFLEKFDPETNIIYKNIQKIVDINGVEYEIKTIDNVIVE